MAAKAKRQPVYLTVKKLIDPATGETVAAMVPASAADRSILRERKIRVGQQLRSDLTKPRNEGFHRLVHALGTLVRENIDGYRDCTAHEAIKQLQMNSGHGCDETRTPVPGMGELVSRQPKSIAYDCMDQAEFYQLARNLCRYIAETYWPQCTPEQVERMVDLMPQEETA